MAIGLAIAGYLMATMIAFYILCVLQGLAGEDPDDDPGMKFGVSFLWPILLAFGMLLLPFKIMKEAAKATVKSLEKRRRDKDET